LTGDKIETAINIGFACKLIDEEMEMFIINKESTRDIYAQMCEYLEKSKQIGNIRDTSVVIGGEQLSKILNNYRNKKMMETFLKLTDNAVSVLCCRVSPKQKAEIVKLIIKAKDNITTLAIGDGANDVNMITAAHIGVGISGLEGQ
jgi:phospholipid-transporting ATPase